ncbi:MAG TPA: ferritin-like domain-containing protein [Solirubrobacterales bacterium]|nr:ferritin-like domain-containing protein [Solirubrobacterales bacterium]
MSSHDLLARFDQDEALAETHHDAVESLDEGDSRRAFLKKAGLGGAAVMGSGALLAALTPAGAAAASGKGRPPAKFGKGDIGILNYALTLEYLEAAFYNEATKKNIAKKAQAKAFLKRTTADENAHVAFLKKALGSKAVAAPKVEFGSALATESSFLKTAMVLENTGVKAYGGQALNISNPAYVSAALSIWAVEARHASVAGLLVKDAPESISPEKGAFQTTATAAEVLKAVEATGFLK